MNKINFLSIIAFICVCSISLSCSKENNDKGEVENDTDTTENKPVKKDYILVVSFDFSTSGNHYTESLSEENIARIKSDPEVGDIVVEFTGEEGIVRAGRSEFSDSLEFIRKHGLKVKSGTTVYMGTKAINNLTLETLQAVKNFGIILMNFDTNQEVNLDELISNLTHARVWL